MPRDLALMEVEQHLVTEGEDQLKAIGAIIFIIMIWTNPALFQYITAFFKLNRILTNTKVVTHAAHWSIEQFNLLNDQIDWYISVMFDAELRLFWPAIFEFFFIM